MALCRLKTMGTSSRTVTRRRRRKKNSRCSTSPSPGSNSLAGDRDASAVTTWQAAVHAGGAARLRMASTSFTRHTFLEHFVNGREAGEERRRWRRSGCSCDPDAAPWHCRGFADQALKTEARRLWRLGGGEADFRAG